METIKDKIQIGLGVIILIFGLYVIFIKDLSVVSYSDGQKHYISDNSFIYGEDKARELAKSFCADQGKKASPFETKSSYQASSKTIKEEWHFTCLN